MQRFAGLILLSVPLAASASAGCRRLPVDPEFPAGFEGRYEVVGKSANTGVAYAGTLTVSDGKNAYVVSRKIGADKESGTAWLQSCGMDKIRSLVVSIDARGGKFREVCNFDADGDNYYRVTCRIDQGGRSGIEAWFQLP